MIFDAKNKNSQYFEDNKYNTNKLLNCQNKIEEKYNNC